MDADVWNAQVAQGYDESSGPMYVLEVLDATVDFLERRAGRCPAPEFAVGTGRVALPLSGRGVRVVPSDSWWTWRIRAASWVSAVRRTARAAAVRRQQ